MRTATKPRLASPHNAAVWEIDHLALLLVSIRPDWDESLVRMVLLSHAQQCDASDLALAAIRAARSPDVQSPHWIGHRGWWWDLAVKPPEFARPKARCQICGRVEVDCYTQRPGADDDHVFEPPPDDVDQVVAS